MKAWRPPPLPQLPPDAHKGTAGRVLLLCGSAWMPGAAVLSARGAGRSGAGLVTVACQDDVLRHVVPLAAPECVLVDARAIDYGSQGWHAGLVGPGLGSSPETHDLVRAFLRSFEGPVVVDADALTLCAREPELLTSRRFPVVMTPHPGEAARLLGHDCGSSAEARAAAAREIARRYRAICCLKGQHTVVTDGERLYVNDTGNPGMATAGTGDVLAGITVAYLARGRTLPRGDFTAYEAAAAAVWVHGRAGDLAAAQVGPTGLVASDLVGSLPAAQRT